MQNQLPWLVSILAIPALFTFFGTILGFLVGELKDRWQASRSRKAFLGAIAIELGSIKTELEQAAKGTEILFQRLQESGIAPQLIPKWGTTVFDTQLGKLGSVADDQVLRTIKTYTTVGRIERIVELVNENSQAFVNAKPGNEKTVAQSRLGSALLVARDEIPLAVREIQSLLEKLDAPGAGCPGN
jgi:hypothetical protein